MININDYTDGFGDINDSLLLKLIEQGKYDEVFELAEACLDEELFVQDGFTWLEELRAASYERATAKLEELKLMRNHEYMMYSCNPAEEDERMRYKNAVEEDLERKWCEDHQQLKELVEGVIVGKEATRESILAALRGEGNEVTIDLVQWESCYEDLSHAFTSWGEAGMDYFPKIAELIRTAFPDILDIVIESCSLNIEDEALLRHRPLSRPETL